MRIKWTPSTIGALAVIIGGITLRCIGINAEMWSLTMIASGFLFGEQFEHRQIERKVKTIQAIKAKAKVDTTVDADEILE